MMIKNIFSALKKVRTYADEINVSYISVLLDYINAYLHYGFNNEDYFVIGNGYTLSRYQKQRYFTIKRALLVQKRINNPQYTHLLENKVEALKLFDGLVKRNWLYVPDSNFEDFKFFVKKVTVFIAKPINGSRGQGIEKHDSSNYNEQKMEELFKHFAIEDMLLEECLKPHDDINFGTTALSTFRIYTIMGSKGEVNILKAKYRVGTGSAITDTADGCIAYPISIKYGIIEGPGINEMLNSPLYYYHPGCDKNVVGLHIPMWDKVIETVTKAAMQIPQVRYIGWDIAISNKGQVEIIEGNHDPYHGTFEIMGTERLWWPKIKALM